MSKRYLLLFLCAFCSISILTFWQSSPGYMDAEYYYMGAVRLYRGCGFTEDILWNFLNIPDSLPQPSHTYWMPLTSLLAYLGMLIGGGEGFERARWVFVFIASFVPLITVKLSHSITNDRNLAFTAGILTLLPFMYFPYLATTDSFGVSMFMGGMFFLIFPRECTHILGKSDWFRFFAIGVVSGLMHLTRIEGFLWLVMALTGIGFICKKMDWPYRFASLLIIAMGYLLVMGPWFWRNIHVIGALMPSASLRTLWVLDYDELFIYPSDQLTFQRYIEAGLDYLARMRLRAGWLNLQTVFFIQGQIILAPLMIIGIWEARRDTRLRLGLLGCLLTFVLMTLIFPAQGSRGGYFHAVAAFQPLLWSVVPMGFMRLIRWGVQKRSWNFEQSKLIFGVAVAVLLLFLTVFAVERRVLGLPLRELLWNRNQRVYASVEKVLNEHGAHPEDMVMVNDAPGYYIFSNRKAISIPFGDYHTVIEVLKKFQAKYLILEFDQIPDAKLFSSPVDTGELCFLASIDEARIYSFRSDVGCNE